MKISGIETVRIEERPNLLWVEVHTDEGITGLGETFYGARTVEEYLHEYVAPRVIGRDPLAIDLLSADLVGYLGFRSSGAEVRGNSAFDIALWDIFGKATGQPIAQLLGGFSRQSIRTYNTCAGTEYIKDDKGQTTANYGLDAGQAYDDLNGFLHRAGELAEELARRRHHRHEDLAVRPCRREDARPAHFGRGPKGGARAVREDPQGGRRPGRHHGRVPLDVAAPAGDQHRQGARSLSAPTGTRTRSAWTASPTSSATRRQARRRSRRRRRSAAAPAFRELLETGAAGIVMLDISWCGGLSEARKIAAMAEAWKLPVAPHDCTGPVVLAASTHLSLNAPNALVQESVRAFYRTWYRDLVTALPEVKDGMITVPPGPGLGLELNPELGRAYTVHRRISDKANI